MKPVNQKAWLLILPVILCVAFSAIVPLMTVVNYSVQDIISPERRVFVGTEWFKAVMRDEDLHGALLRQMGFSLACCWWRFRWASRWRCRCRPRAGRRRRCW
jgi:glycerol transport system permease protein